MMVVMTVMVADLHCSYGKRSGSVVSNDFDRLVRMSQVSPRSIDPEWLSCGDRRGLRCGIAKGGEQAAVEAVAHLKPF
jgi:hypothetical protein